MKTRALNRNQAGFSLLEMMVVVTIGIIITVIAIPGFISTQRYLRVTGDLRALNGITAQAKMRAAAEFTHARAYADLAAGTYHLELWNKAGNGGTGCWQTDGDTANACTAGSSPVLNLSTGDVFGFGTLGTGPTPGQPAPTQAAACRQGAPGVPGGGGTIGNTACIEFNSRGIPVDNTGAPVATGALYIYNNVVVDGVTVSATGSIQTWSSPASSATWYPQ
jgi:prepilin-type N-terminal cleavage/methylation domain-containing protein